MHEKQESLDVASVGVQRLKDNEKDSYTDELLILAHSLLSCCRWTCHGLPDSGTRLTVENKMHQLLPLQDVWFTMLRAASDILSNSSMQQMPLSLSTNAPLSRTISRVSGSCDVVNAGTQANEASHVHYALKALHNTKVNKTLVQSSFQKFLPYVLNRQWCILPSCVLGQGLL